MGGFQYFFIPRRGPKRENPLQNMAGAAGFGGRNEVRHGGSGGIFAFGAGSILLAARGGLKVKDY